LEDKSAAIRSRKLTFTELLSLAFEVYRKKFKFLALAGLAVFIPMSLLMMLIYTPDYYLTFDSNGLLSVTDWRGFAMSCLLILAVNAAFTPLFVSVATHVCKRHVEGAPCGAVGMMEASLSKWGKLAVTAALYYALTAIGSLFFLLPGVYFAVSCAFYANHMSDSRSWGVRALMESYAYVRENWFRTLGFLVVINVITTVAVVLVQNFLLYSLLGDSAAAYVIESVLSEFVSMFFTIATALWFLNRRYLLDSR